MISAARRFGSCCALAALAGCQGEALTALDLDSSVPSSPEFDMASGEWSEPIHLGPEVNSSSRELAATLSPDGLSLYFNSDRPEGFGSFDIYVSRRACLECPWEQAQNIGEPINGPDNGGNAALSHDGHLLFFLSDREGTFGKEDLWVSRRSNPNDDFGWGPPVNLGPFVNTEANEAGPSYVAAAPGGHAQLYFNRELENLVVMISRDGEVVGPPEPVDLEGEARSMSVRKDGRELVFWAPASRGGLGAADVWVSRRRNITEPWGTPTNLGGPVNTAGGELESAISLDGMTLLFSGTASRGSSFGLQDIWISNRRRD